MHEMFALLVERPGAAASGLLGLVCLTIWPLFHSRAAILAAQLGIGVGYGLHYILLEAWTGAGITALGASQTLCSMFIGGHPRVRAAAFAFLPLPGVVAAATWAGPPSLLAAVALTLIMLGRMQLDQLRMRVFLIAAAPFGMVYDYSVGSLPALAGGAIAMALGLVMFVRETRPMAVRVAVG